MGEKKKHPWRICDAGSYFVRSHYKTLSSGKRVKWSAHCRKHISKKDLLSADEIKEIFSKYSKAKYKKPKAYNFKSPYGNKFDNEIGFWVKFWSDIFGKNTNTTPNFVKTLIMTESSFLKEAWAQTHNNSGKAIGLMQITEYTFKLLKENQKELSNYYFKLSKKDIEDPIVNICVGVRWLFRKRDIAKYYLKKEPSELELAEEYKGIRNDKSLKAKDQRNIFKKYTKELKNEI